MSNVQSWIKAHYDLGWHDAIFSISDIVYLKIQPYRRFSLHQLANQKLTARFFGPYKVLERVREVAYSLELPDEATIHSVFHAFKFKGWINIPSMNSLDFPCFATIGKLDPLSTAITNHHRVHRNSCLVHTDFPWMILHGRTLSNSTIIFWTFDPWRQGS